MLSFTPPEPPRPWKIGVTFDGGHLTDKELERITPDPAEHDRTRRRSRPTTHPKRSSR
ncbi:MULTISPECIES: hypothetical protein [unclassified Kitasatospora]|uniref:hypothetical protein n=1 Tax=unclassified Kitasatospora TaxID=2633591 RepID=UPI0034279B21